jgi:hypothetical protein
LKTCFPIKVINMMNKITIYLSGPVRSGSVYNPDIFYKYENIFTKKNYNVINPLRLAKKFKKNKKVSPGYSEISAYNLMYMVQKADAVAVLPGWDLYEESKLEVTFALTFGIPVYNGVNLEELNLGVDILFYDKDVITELSNEESFGESFIELIDKINNFEGNCCRNNGLKCRDNRKK